MTTLDETLAGGDPGHLNDHEYIAGVINRMKHICKVGITGTVNLASGSYTLIGWNSEIEDDYGYHDPAVPSRVTVPAGVPTGWYRASLLVGFPVSTAGTDRAIRIYDKLGNIIGAHSTRNGGSTEVQFVPADGLVELAAGDWITAEAYHNIGTTQALHTSSRLSLQRVCDS